MKHDSVRVRDVWFNPRSQQKGRVVTFGPMVKAGKSNHLIVYREGEILVLITETSLRKHYVRSSEHKQRHPRLSQG